MISHKSTFYLGIFVFIIPFLGFPTAWKMGLVVFGGLMLMIISLKTPTPRKIVKSIIKKEKVEQSLEISKTIETAITPPEIKEVREAKPIVKDIKIEKPVSAPIEIVTVTPKPRKPKVLKVDSVKKPRIKQL